MLNCNLVREVGKGGRRERQRRRNWSDSSREEKRGFEFGLVIGGWRPSITIQTRDLSVPFKLLIWLLAMPFVWFFRLFGKVSPRLLIGIDFGASGIKLVQLKEDKGKLALVRADFEPFGLDVIVDGAIMNMAQLTDALRRLVERNKIAGKKVAFGVSGHSVISKKICLPEMTEQELDSSIMWEAEQYIPFDIREVYVDVEIIDPMAGQGLMDVLLTAAKKDAVNDYVQILAEVGLRPALADVEVYALMNMFEAMYGFPPGERVTLVNVGASMINVAIVDNGKVAFNRDVSLGSMLLTEEIQRNFNVSFEQAEEWKTAKPEDIASLAVFKDVERLKDRVANTLAVEIQRSVEFFKATSVGGKDKIKAMYLFGGGAKMTALARALELQLEMPVEFGISFAKVEGAEDNQVAQKMSSEFAVAVGLALRRG